MPKVRLLQAAKDSAWTLAVDAIVLGNAIVLFYEVEAGPGKYASFQLVRIVFCSVYMLEMLVRLFKRGRSYLYRAANVAELAIVILASGCVFGLGGEPAWLWRLTVFRSFRIAHIANFADKWWPLKELWLVLTGFSRAAWTLCWLATVLVLVIYCTAGAAVGLSRSAAGEEAEDCFEGGCLDTNEYFGSQARSALTLMQLVTMDGWAVKIVRPLSSSRPLAAVFLTVFAMVSSYGLLSVAVGVLVKSTLSLAKSHGTHASQIRVTEDVETVASLRTYFEASLLLDDRTTITERELRDAQFVPAVAKAFKQLDLPLTDMKELFRHLDKNRKGAITVEEFEHHLRNMVKPSTALDVCSLTASIGGSVTYVSRMGRRSDVLMDQMDTLRDLLETSYSELGRLADPHLVTSPVAEVGLRQKGVIYNPIPPGPPRYTR
mmetsp:Transcript_83008/g.216377  ORF Transcript_83008/g.216377 Transcript_83008/m.216377 type:complete len:433 (-) Transcript_83008:35-1333(-)